MFLFLDSKKGGFEDVKAVFSELAKEYMSKGLRFLIADIEYGKDALQVLDFSVASLFIFLSYLSMKMICDCLLIFTLFCIQFFGLRKDKLPSIAIQDKDEHTHILEEAYPGKIRTWFKDYFVSGFMLIWSKPCMFLHVFSV